MADTMGASMEPLFPLAHFAAGLNGPGGKRTHPTTLTRWIQKGVRLPDGTRLKLQAVRAGSRWMVSEAAWATFLDAQTRAFAGADSPPAPAPRTPAARRKASEEAERELARLGI